MELLHDEIRKLADEYSQRLSKQLTLRLEEMKGDDVSHYLIYRVLGISDEEGALIDEYQNKGRFLYKYAGSFLEEAALLCFQRRFPLAGKIRIPNTHGSRPRMFEVDCLAEDRAHEIKWRDATTDGDHITKEHARVKVIREHGYIPVRVMFFYPQREQAKRIQETLETLYEGIGGKYYYGDGAWEYMKSYTGTDLRCLLEAIASEREGTRC